jgi:hypothetical protein
MPSHSAPLRRDPHQPGRLQDWEILQCQRQKWDWINMNPAPVTGYSRRAEILRGFQEYKKKHPAQFEK